MTIWAIADIHASRTDAATGRPLKPMDPFGPEWVDHVNRLERAWKDRVQPDDTVVVAGDIDWALTLDQAMETINRIASWPGNKVLIRGNHDYWWSSKTTNRVRRAMPEGIELLHNNAFVADGYNICGAKGSPVPGGAEWTDTDARLLAREVVRLRVSLDARDPGLPTIVALHYPPFYPPGGESPYRDLMKEYGVRFCVYGHLHGDARSAGPAGDWDRTFYTNVAGDAVGFTPVRVGGIDEKEESDD